MEGKRVAERVKGRDSAYSEKKGRERKLRSNFDTNDI